tara:strand:- start:3193 stop:3540 length:348 start_codon:yes stop_codon:yes gene_type:complete
MKKRKGIKKVSDKNKFIDNDSSLKTQVKNKVKKPSLYKVLILNDDYTPMEFVIYLLKSFFNKSNEEATKIMLHVHQNGIGVCGVFSYEIAETKVIQVLDTSRKNNHPLQCTMEKA